MTLRDEAEPVRIDVLAADPVARRIVAGLAVTAQELGAPDAQAKLVRRINAVSSWLLGGGPEEARPDVRGYARGIRLMLTTKPSQAWIELLKAIGQHVAGQGGVSFDVQLVAKGTGN